VQDAFDAGERGQNFRAQQTVGVADDANLHRRAVFMGGAALSAEAEEERPAAS
jgi:hypothetical protein